MSGDAFQRFRTLSSKPSGKPAPASELMPVLYSPLGMWSLNLRDGSGLVDRSGNGRHLTITQGTKRAPDLIDGAVTPHKDGQLRQALRGPWMLEGELTIACRAWVHEQATLQMLCQSNWSYGANGDYNTNTAFSFYITDAGKLGTYHQINGHSPQVVTTAASVPYGRWCWFTKRRLANGVIKLGTNLTYETLGPLPLPNLTGGNGPGGGGCRLAIADGWDPGAPLLGGMADFGIWDRALTDAELVPLYTPAMKAAA